MQTRTEEILASLRKEITDFDDQIEAKIEAKAAESPRGGKRPGNRKERRRIEAAMGQYFRRADRAKLRSGQQELAQAPSKKGLHRKRV